MSLIAKRFEKNEPPYTAAEISEEHQIPIRLTNQVLYQLQEIELIHEVVTDEKSEEIGYQPSMDINQLNVAAGPFGHIRLREFQNRQRRRIQRRMEGADRIQRRIL